MSAQAPERALATLQRQIDLARARVEATAERRRELEAALAAARAAEQAEREALAALEAVGRDAFDTRTVSGAGEGIRLLTGVELREMIARVALRRTALGEPTHWSEWHSWLRDAGFDAAGKNPGATFLTQLARSPLVQRTHQDGVYVLDVGLLARERNRLGDLHRRLSALPPPGQLALLGDLRAQRRELQNETVRTERAVEEMWRVLAAERPPGWCDSNEHPPEQAVVAWLEIAGAG